MPTLTDPALPIDAKSAAPAGEKVRLAWRGHRLREEPTRVPQIAGAYAASVFVWWLVLPQPLLLSVPLLCLTVALNDFLFPMQFRLTDKGAHVDGGLTHLFIAWADVRRATTGKDGVYLSPFAKSTRLEAFRGVRLRFAGNAEVVLSVVRQLRSEAHPQ